VFSSTSEACLEHISSTFQAFLEHNEIYIFKLKKQVITDQEWVFSSTSEAYLEHSWIIPKTFLEHVSETFLQANSTIKVLSNSWIHVLEHIWSRSTPQLIHMYSIKCSKNASDVLYSRTRCATKMAYTCIFKNGYMHVKKTPLFVLHYML
jgi:hypothetical protein